MHPSFEDRDGAPDRVFAKLDDAGYERLVDAWADALEQAGAADADVLHLNHLTPMHAAAARVAPDVPVVGHVHGTELLMLEAIAAGPPAGWDHAEAWARAHAPLGRARRDRLILLSDTQDERVERDARHRARALRRRPQRLRSRELRRSARSTGSRCGGTWLVDDPQGWRPGGEPGSVALRAGRPRGLRRTRPVLLYVGRYTAVKRIGAPVARVRAGAGPLRGRAPLVLLGGYPGEWEGEHPRRRDRAHGRGATSSWPGWHGHDELPDFFAASDAVVLPSVREQFGQVLVEGMACGLPAIAVDAHGPGEIVDDGDTGWLVEPDDEEALARCARGRGERPGRARAPRRGGARGASASATPGRRWPEGSADVYARLFMTPSRW